MFASDNERTTKRELQVRPRCGLLRGQGRRRGRGRGRGFLRTRGGRGFLGDRPTSRRWPYRNRGRHSSGCWLSRRRLRARRGRRPRAKPHNQRDMASPSRCSELPPMMGDHGVKSVGERSSGGERVWSGSGCLASMSLEGACQPPLRLRVVSPAAQTRSVNPNPLDWFRR
jgi:hypothetical protein